MYDKQPVPDLKVVVADFDPLARRALADMLRAEGGFVIAAQAGTAVEALELVAHYAPDVLVVEAALVAEDRLALARRVRERRPEVGVVMVSAAHDDELVIEALQLGVTGVVTKHASGPALAYTLRAVARGEAVLGPQPTMALIRRMRRIPVAGRGFRPIRSHLTNREWEILDLLISEAGTREIAERLVLTEETVQGYVKSILRKLDARSRAEAVAAARRLYEVPLAA
jgi:NarL family two-component system response regulator LiaR